MAVGGNSDHLQKISWLAAPKKKRLLSEIVLT